MTARRSSGTRRRDRTRFTPRRWLPFLVLGALVVTSVVLQRGDEPAADPGAASDDLVTVLPAVASPGALSTAWFCGGGSAEGEAGLADMTIVIANDAPRGATADVTVYDDRDGRSTESVDVPAFGRARVSARSVHAGEWVAATVDVRGGRAAVDREVKGPLGFDVAPCATAAANQWYVPSGSTLRGAQEYLAVFNPFPDDASVNIDFATETGARQPKLLQGLSVPGQSLRMVRVGDTVTARARIAAKVRTRAGRVVVDRVQLYDGTGDEVAGAGVVTPTPAPRGLVSGPAVSALASRWYFTGGAVSAGGRNQVALYNPSDRDAPVDVAFTYERPAANPPTEPIQLTVPAGEQVVADFTEDQTLVPDVAFAVDVRSLDDVGVVAERLAFASAPATQLGASAVTGSPVAASRWLLAQGGPSQARSASVVVANPGPRATRVRVFEIGGGTRRPVAAASVTVPAGDRRPLDVAGVGAAATLDVMATDPVVVSYRLAQSDGNGVALASAEPFPETLARLPPTG
ncbi:MAG: DUF5719 family protein [Acidimicrobiales bacterium]